MEAEAIGTLTEIVGTVVFSVFAGAILGVIVWRLPYGLAIGTACLIAYLLITPLTIPWRWERFAAINALPMVMTFLASFVTARWLGGRMHAVWASAAALACGVVVSFLYASLFAKMLLDNRSPVLFALGADVVLLGLAIRPRRSVSA